MEKKSRILIVDDVAENRKLLATTIKKYKQFAISLASDGSAVLKAIEKDLPDLILLDIMMPEMDGFEVSKALKSNEHTKNIPIIFLTAMTDVESKIKAFESGGVDYVSKPFNENELLARINTHVELKQLQDDLQMKVDEQTEKIANITMALVNALETANLVNDDDTGNHIKRVGSYSAFLAEQYGCPEDFVSRIKLYAPLHDIGKVGLPDALLKKNGRYSKDEFIAMQEHVRIGARILGSEDIDPMARNVAMYHHEKWDGTGYTQQLAGEAIPVEARIVSIADVYDALISKRVYKDAFPDETAERIIREESGHHFEPKLVDLFLDNIMSIREIRNDTTMG
ncbi:response regulator [candidate division KSB3 bacterium]|uniref:Response regulator n=1 Tax=candidate division KSB3 bacterium TaxID=2044937 RepID=A0A9D5Q6F8_9BACT|nr:response regulator [candidate division KSB3 bacterium]MBD3325799.1 response regulator [candidate division KSB3 bacterium]